MYSNSLYIYAFLIVSLILTINFSLRIVLQSTPARFNIYNIPFIYNYIDTLTAN